MMALTVPEHASTRPKSKPQEQTPAPTAPAHAVTNCRSCWDRQGARMKYLLLSSTILLAASTGLMAEEVRVGDPQAGFAYAKEVCANCHAIVSNGTSPVPEAPAFDEIADRMSARAILVDAVATSDDAEHYSWAGGLDGRDRLHFESQGQRATRQSVASIKDQARSGHQPRC